MGANVIFLLSGVLIGGLCAYAYFERRYRRVVERLYHEQHELVEQSNHALTALVDVMRESA